jgi:MFS family permease
VSVTQGRAGERKRRAGKTGARQRRFGWYGDITWYGEISPTERRTFWACFGGWALDAVDAQMFGLAIPALIATFGLSKGEAGLIGGVTLFASAFGGWAAGTVADRIGRVKALQIMILSFAIATFLCAFAQSFDQLLVLKSLQGFAFGGEWAAGAVLIGEMVRPQHRGKALGTMQSAWAIGTGAAILLYTAMFSWFPQEMAWRVMFGVGLLPALLVLYVRRSIPEPVMLAAAKAKPKTAAGTLFGIFAPDALRMTLIGGLLGTGAHGGYYALTTFLPTFLRTERKLSVLGTGGYLAVITFAFFCGCIVAGYLSDRIGRRRNLVFFAMACVVTVLIYIFVPLGNTAMLFLGFPLGFFSAGIPASMGALFSELYENGIRGTGVGFCYNFGRIASAAFPVAVGYLSQKISLGAAIGIDAAFGYSLVVLAILMLPETKAKSFTAEAGTALS